jgi:hypothetical protein
MIVLPDGSTSRAVFQTSRSVPAELEAQKKGFFITEIKRVFKRSAPQTKCSSSGAVYYDEPD